MKPGKLLPALILALAIAAAAPAAAGDESASGPPATYKPAFADLRDKAADALHHDFLADAAQYYCDIQLLYPERPEAEDALWQCAELRRKIAASATAPDWRGVKEVYRRFIEFYPRSDKLANAYLEVGKAYARIRFYREALSYFKLFMREFPDSPLAAEAQRRLGKALVKVGRLREAESLFATWSRSGDPAVKPIGLTGMGDVRFAQGKLGEAKNYYQMVLINFPDYYVRDPSVLGGAGLVNLRLGNAAKGRRQLYHYLSLEGVVDNRVEILFALAESYYREGNHLTAAGLYRRIGKLASPGSRAAVISALRLAQYQDDKEIVFSKWEQGADLTDPAGDAPYLATLEKFFNDPRAQDARYGLFRRYQARDELDKALEMGRNFLRNVPEGADDGTTLNRVGTILLYLVEELLGEKRYQDIYDLYFVAYRHVKDYPDGRLLYMVGQALENLSLLDQASVVYYRAMKWPLPEPDKVALYFRRAHVYLANKDYAAAGRLLKYLRTLYGKTEFAGAVSAYSARLAEAEGDLPAALEYYKKAFAAPTYPERRGGHAVNIMRLALRLDRPGDALEAARRCAHEGLADVDVLQEWLLAVGDAFRDKGQWGPAAEAYGLGLEQQGGRPERLQALRLYLGDAYYARKKIKRALELYGEVVKGPDSPWKKLAGERLRAHRIGQAVRKAERVP